MLTINTGPETAKMLEQNRRSLNAIKTSTRRVASSVELESAADDPGMIGSVTFTDTPVSGIQYALRSLNEKITATQSFDQDFSLVEDLLLTLRDVAKQATQEPLTNSQREGLQVQAEEILSKLDEAINVNQVEESSPQQEMTQSVMLRQQSSNSAESLKVSSSGDRVILELQQQMNQSESSLTLSANDRSTIQSEQRAQSRQRLQEMTTAVEIANQRNVAAASNLAALRQLGQAQISTQEANTMSRKSRVPTLTSANPADSLGLEEILDQYDKTRAAEDKMIKAQRYLQEMKSFTLEILVSSNRK